MEDGAAAARAPEVEVGSKRSSLSKLTIPTLIVEHPLPLEVVGDGAKKPRRTSQRNPIHPRMKIVKTMVQTQKQAEKNLPQNQNRRKKGGGAEKNAPLGSKTL